MEAENNIVVSAHSDMPSTCIVQLHSAESNAFKLNADISESLSKISWKLCISLCSYIYVSDIYSSEISIYYIMKSTHNKIGQILDCQAGALEVVLDFQSFVQFFMILSDPLSI